MKPDSDTYQVS